MIKITGLWPTKAGTGWTGRSGNTRVMVLPVDKSKSRSPGRAPDYELVLAPVDDTRPLTPLPAPVERAGEGSEYSVAGERPSTAGGASTGQQTAFDMPYRGERLSQRVKDAATRFQAPADDREDELPWRG